MANQFQNPNEGDNRAAERAGFRRRLKNNKGIPLDVYNPNANLSRKRLRSGLQPLSRAGEKVVLPNVTPTRTPSQTRTRTKHQLKHPRLQ